MLDAGVDLRDVQIAAQHADPRTTMRYDRARKNLTAIPTTSSLPTWPAPLNVQRPHMPMCGQSISSRSPVATFCDRTRAASVFGVRLRR
jgi:hypothetical protein